jgi:hypothetical protein
MESAEGIKISYKVACWQHCTIAANLATVSDSKENPEMYDSACSAVVTLVHMCWASQINPSKCLSGSCLGTQYICKALLSIKGVGFMCPGGPSKYRKWCCRPAVTSPIVSLTPIS